MRTPLHILSGKAPGMALHPEVGTGLGMEVGMDLGLAVDRFLVLAPGTEEDTPPELAPGTSPGRGPGMGGGTPPQPSSGTALGSFEDTEEAHMAAGTAARERTSLGDCGT